MKQSFLAIILLCGLVASAQTKKIFLNPVAYHPDKFHFNKITVIDTRLDTNVVGWVTKGIDNILVPAVFEEPATARLNRFYQDATGHLWNQGTHELIIHVTDLFLMEDPEMIGTVGNMDIRMQAFIKHNDQYYSIHKMDRQEPFQAFDVTQKMFRTLNSYLLEFVTAANEKFTTDITHKTMYTWDQVLAIRQKEIKDKYPLYRVEKPEDGIYETSTELYMQTPTYPIETLEKRINENLSKPKRKRQKLFAYCKDGQLHLFQNSKTYETTQLYRRDNNFFKQDYGLDPQKQAASAALGWAFGLLAEAIASDVNNGNQSWYEFIFNPRNAIFYHHKLLGKTKEEYEAKQNKEGGTGSSTTTN